MPLNKKALFPFGVSAIDFKVGQRVQRIINDHTPSVFVGTVTAIIPAIEKVDVQWPTGVSREDPEWLIPTTEALGVDPSVSFNAINQGLGVNMNPGIAVVVGNYLKRLASVYSLAKNMRKIGSTEVNTYEALYTEFSDRISDQSIRDVVLVAYQPRVASKNQKFKSTLEIFLSNIDA